jgi:biotin synthase
MIEIKMAQKLYDLPFFDLLDKARAIHKENWPECDMQLSTLLNIKTGACPENCAYCPQSAHFKTGLEKEPLYDKTEVIEAAKKAKEIGSQRFCVGAAWRGPRDDDIEKVGEMIAEIKEMGLETCATLGLLKDGQAEKLKEYGLDYYNHNIDTSKEYYHEIITTRTFQDRIDTINRVRASGLKVCCGGILGMGEKTTDRLNMLVILANMDPYPESVPINKLIPIPGTPMANKVPVSEIEFVKTIAIARILMPKARVRLSAGRENMSDSMQTLCFYAGANSVFYGEKLLTANNSSIDRDNMLFDSLGINNG